MSTILTEGIAILTGGIVEYAQGLGAGLSALVTSLFVAEGEGGTKTLADFGGMAFLFAGISLAVGLSRWFLNWITSIGARNR